ncbi:hypothetical protein ACH50O_12325 [Methylomonas sp. 2BW1-5-20]|uniref:hypothetical protein n=1 Tax=Methylomonas sp. 2BW1-5-20 TaxID=3376686 RepID=UPI0040506687
MPKSTFIPAADHDFLVWFDHFLANLTPERGVAADNLTSLKSASDDFHAKTAFANNAAATAKQATADKNDSRRLAESLIRAEVRRIKARADYTGGLGAQLGIEGAEYTNDLATSNPNLNGVDQTGGKVSLSFTKYNSEGINIYCQRDGDADWVLLGRATVSPFADNRPLLQPGKPELRRYTAIYMVKDKEVGQFSNDLVINCAP